MAQRYFMMFYVVSFKKESTELPCIFLVSFVELKRIKPSLNNFRLHLDVLDHGEYHIDEVSKAGSIFP